MITIYIRKDLNMRKGKMAAQASHAFMAALLSFFETKDNLITITRNRYEYIKKYLMGNSVDIEFVDNEEELLEINSINNNNSVLITDQGRTEFNGIPTNTCLACFHDKNVQVKRIDCSRENDSNYLTKQVIVFNSELFKGENKTDKVSYIKNVVIYSFHALLSEFEEDGDFFVLNRNKSDVYAWLSGSFAKVVLQANTNELLNLIETFDPDKFNHIISVYDINDLDLYSSISFAPRYVEDIDKVTGHLKLF